MTGASNETQGTSIPYVWTTFTSILVEESILFLLSYFVLINYIVYKNRMSFESAWETRDFYKMLLIASTCSLASQLAIRLSLLGVFKNMESYKACRYSGLNFIVVALLLGLRQQAHKRPAPRFQAVISKNESKSGVK